jgi:penicillin-binding protein 2
MIELPLQRRTPLPPQLTRRVGVLGVVALILFGVLAFRLWYLQVLTGTQNATAAIQNVVRDIPIPAQRGRILDSSGNVLATYRYATVVAIVKDRLPPPGPTRRALYRRLAHVLRVPWKSVQATVDDIAVAPPGYAPTTIATSVPHRVLAYLGERKHRFPGVEEDWEPVRYYPNGDIGSVVLGQLGQVSGGGKGAPDELKMARFRGVKAGTVVGQSGLEWQYQPYLQGKTGALRVKVDAAGYPVGGQPKVTPPTPGDQLVTSLNLALEREGYAAVRRAQAAARKNGYAGSAGSFFAMDPRTGRVLAVGSVPTYDANDFATGVISQSTYDSVLHSGGLIDRAIYSHYPTGSTFKPITALAGLNSGIITTQTLQGGGACYTSGIEHFCNSGNADYGDLDLVHALQVSEDTYFYPIGAAANGVGNGLAIQRWARWLGLGHAPGIDLPGASAGLVPDRAYVNALNQSYLSSHCRHQAVGSRPKPAYVNDTLAVTACAQDALAYWTVGQDIQLATGQGMLEASPAQMAIAYSAIFNGGTVWNPQLGSEILSPSGRVLQQLPAPSAYRHVRVDPAYRRAIMAGLHEAAQTPQGTSYATFGNFPRRVYGKTGTAQHNGQADQSWYVAYAPDAKRPIVIAVTIEQGGFGAAAAAPAVGMMLAKWFGLPPRFVAGTNQTW